MTATRLAIIYSRAQTGLEAPLVSVEAHISRGLPKLSIVGLAEAEVRESKDRVRSAILNSGFDFPPLRITINLAPADLPKGGGRFDLPIALGILVASGQLPSDSVNDLEFAGELALSGQLRPFKGALPFAIASRKAKRGLIIPTENAFEAAMPQDNLIYNATSLKEVCEHLQGTNLLKPFIFNPPVTSINQEKLDMADIQGQHLAKRALEIAAAGRHSILIIGPPGTGKTMLASRLSTIMPQLTPEEALDVAAIYSLQQTTIAPLKWLQRPFRAPHHTASAVALVGGGSNPRPGEISLAHHGVLFLDELPEYDRAALEVLREPLESGSVIISRAARNSIFPARFQLIAAMNPCPCGHRGNHAKQCRCTPEQIMRYQAKISGPLLDRIDLHIEVPTITTELLTQNNQLNNESSAIIRKRVESALLIQKQRSAKTNNMLSNLEVKKVCVLDKESEVIMKKAIEILNLSARGFYRVLKVARTIADLAQSIKIQSMHLQEALNLRCKM